jgi:hypothetical protein
VAGSGDLVDGEDEDEDESGDEGEDEVEDEVEDEDEEAAGNCCDSNTSSSELASVSS